MLSSVFEDGQEQLDAVDVAVVQLALFSFSDDCLVERVRQNLEVFQQLFVLVGKLQKQNYFVLFFNQVKAHRSHEKEVAHYLHEQEPYFHAENILQSGHHTVFDTAFHIREVADLHRATDHQNETIDQAHRPSNY